MDKRIRVLNGEIRIASPKNLLMLLFLPVWLIGWAFGLAAVIRALLSQHVTERLFLIFWLCGWSIGGLFILYAFLWIAFGYEIVSNQNGFLIIKRSIFGFGWSRKFSLPKISNLRASGLFPQTMSWRLSMAQWGLSGGAVAFDYNGGTGRLGINLAARRSRNQF
jgi:hypothetical protein